MRIAIIGPNGQVGSDVVRSVHAAGIEVVPIRHADADVTDPASLARALADLERGDAVVNTAAFHKTDECEVKPGHAMAVNAMGAYNVAAEARARGLTAVFVSTDFVFDGERAEPYVESDVPRPINAYGVSKLAGEMLTAHADPDHLVVRISSVFGAAGSSGKGGNFVETMLAKAARTERIAVVDDIVMAPTYARDAADLLVALLIRRAPPGIYHLANAGSTSWRGFADAIFEEAGVEARATPIGAEDTPTAAPRPRYSVLASERLASLGLAARPWRDGLRAYLREKGHLRQ